MKKLNVKEGTYLSLGLVLGIVLGLVFNDLAIGMSFGLLLGLAVEMYDSRKTNDKGGKTDNNSTK